MEEQYESMRESEVEQWININYPAHHFSGLKVVYLGHIYLTYLTTLRTSS